MELVKIEEYIDNIHDNIRVDIMSTPKVSGWTAVYEVYDGELYRYTFNTMIRYNEEPNKTHIFSTNSSECIFKINNKNEIVYITQNSQQVIDLDISEEWHFQQMTVKPLISYDSVLKVRKIYEIVKKR